MGYIEETRGIDGRIRKYLGAKHRLPMEQLFFIDTFGNPLTMETVHTYAQPLEMVRLAPSASNKQPCRIIKIGNAWHFFLQRTKGYGKGTLLYKFLQLADLQRVDMGIAMCHFELTARSLGLQGHWIVEEPKSGRDKLQLPEGTEYTVTWISE
jgi:hypothetical protein